MSKSCIHSYVGISLVESSGKLAPCCKFKPELEETQVQTIFDVTTLNTLHNSELYASTQQQLDNNVFPEGCTYCKNAEAVNLQSRRQVSNWLYAGNKLVTPGYIQDLEIALDYTCNMMCRSCNPGASSRWNIAKPVIAEFDKHSIPIDTSNGYKSYQDQFYTVFSNTDLSHARFVKIQGGEPFYAKNLEWFIDKLDDEVVDKTKLYINIFTNGSIFPNKRILEKLSNLNADIVFSLDAYGELASTIRWGVDWTVIEDNIQQWRKFADDHTNVRLLCNTTVSLLNVNKLQPLLDFCTRLNIKSDFSELTYPEYLSIYQLPKHIRERWVYDYPQLNSLIMLDIDFKSEFNKFLKSIDILDSYQGISFKDTNREMYQLIQQLSPC